MPELTACLASSCPSRFPWSFSLGTYGNSPRYTISVNLQGGRCCWRQGLLPDGRDYSPRRSPAGSVSRAEATGEGGGVRPDRQSMPGTPHGTAGNVRPGPRSHPATTEGARLLGFGAARHRRDCLRRFLVCVVLVVAALRGVLAVIAQPFELLVERLDGGFLLAKDFLDQLVALRFEVLFLGEEFLDGIVRHVDYHAIPA